MQAKERIILALDVDDRSKALELVEQLKDYVGAFKVGMQLYNSLGPDIVRDIQDRGGKVFVDLKFHDIPNTVAAAGRVMTRLQCYMFNVHAAGGKEMMERLVQDVEKEAQQLKVQAPLLLAVTVLTSLSQQQLEEELFIKGMNIEELVVQWALMAQAAGMDGVVCSPREIRPIKQACGEKFKTITPGIRPVWAAAQDQKRITTPAQALELGTDYMVIGRPIRAAADPVEAAQKIIDELEAC